MDNLKDYIKCNILDNLNTKHHIKNKVVDNVFNSVRNNIIALTRNSLIHEING